MKKRKQIGDGRRRPAQPDEPTATSNDAGSSGVSTLALRADGFDDAATPRAPGTRNPRRFFRSQHQIVDLRTILWRPISKTSLNPSVVKRPIRAPFAFKDGIGRNRCTVDEPNDLPGTLSPTRRARHPGPDGRRAPGSSGVDGTLVRRISPSLPYATTSVNVPPVSMAN